MAVVVVSVALAVGVNSGGTTSATPCSTTSCTERVALHRCAAGSVPECVRRGALHWRVSYPMLMRKARCESRLDPLATNGTHVGLFQFAWGTWASTPYRSESPWRAKWSSLGAAWMHSAGVRRGGEWACR